MPTNKQLAEWLTDIERGCRKYAEDNKDKSPNQEHVLSDLAGEIAFFRRVFMRSNNLTPKEDLPENQK